MPPIDTSSLVAQIHDSGAQMVLAATGGGSGAISALFSVPGASRSMLLATVPYADTALVEWLGARPEQFCSAKTARAMAMAAYEKAQRLCPTGQRLIGIGCTASLASDRPKRGPHRLFVAVQTAGSTACLELELEKDRRTRAEEESLATLCILNEIADACGLADRLPLPTVAAETPHRQFLQAPDEWRAVLAGQIKRVAIGPPQNTEVIFPGAFNPRHVGHQRMAEVASRKLGRPVAYELSVTNVDKPSLDFMDIQQRLQQFSADETVWLTHAPTFLEKARTFPGAVFVVGVDTVDRIAEQRYYENDLYEMLRVFDRIAHTGCKFLVFGRLMDGRFKTLDNLLLHKTLDDCCLKVPESEFREDTSSTEVRQNPEASPPGP